MDNCEVNKCFDNLIGVFGCHNKGECRYFINDISGISNELLENIADAERSSYLQVFEKAKIGAINSAIIDIQDVMLNDKDRAEFGNELYKSNQARIVKSDEPVIVSNYVGVLITMPSSKYVIAEVGSLSLAPKANVTVIPVMFDFETKEEINRGEEIEVIGGRITDFEFNHNFDCSKHRAIFVGFEIVDVIAGFDLLSCNRFVQADCNTCKPCEAITCDGQESDFRGILMDIDIDQNNDFAIYNIMTSNLADFDSYSEIESIICADVSIVCSMEQFICENAKRIAPALQYLIAHNVLTEKMGSYRQNMWAKGNLEFTAMMREELRKMYKSSLKKIIPKLPLSGESLCWECRSSGVEIGSYV